MHALSRPNDRRRTPYDMFLFGMVTNAPRGLSQLLTPMEENVEDLDMYGIDWEDLENPELIENFLERSADEDEHDEGVNDSEGLHLPAHMANVVCNPHFVLCLMIRLIFFFNNFLLKLMCSLEICWCEGEYGSKH